MPYPRFLRNLAIWLIPSVLIWILGTPFYNTFLRSSAETLVRLSERPGVTHLYAAPIDEERPRQEQHFLVITRDDYKTDRRFLYSVRTTDIHFPMVFMWALFLAVPGAPLTARLAKTGWATLITVFFHIVLVVFWVKFVYATQLGAWSEEHYSTFGQTFWGLGKHLLDLPFKFGLPLILWSAFYWDVLIGGEAPRAPARARKGS